MKDAKGHGSDAHQSGVGEIGKSHLSVQKRDYSAPMGKNWYVRHEQRQAPVGDIGFKTKKEGEAFVSQHLDPTNPKWNTKPGAMHPTYTAARRINMGIKD